MSHVTGRGTRVKPRHRPRQARSLPAFKCCSVLTKCYVCPGSHQPPEKRFAKEVTLALFLFLALFLALALALAL